MKRLRDVEEPSRLIEKAQALIDAVEPVPESRERMLRVRRELDRPRGMLAGLRRLPALVLAALVALFGASAFAAVRYLAARPEPVEQGRAPVNTTLAQRAHHGGHQPAAEQPVTEALKPVAKRAVEPVAAAAPRTPAAQSIPGTSAANASDQPAPARAVTHAGTDSPPRSTAHATLPRVAPHAAAREAQRADPSIEARAPGSDSALVHRAVQALRRDGDPALAARLLADNRKRYPNGPLAEEALSLQIEAALALHDAHARAFAREYVTQYPNGRYLAVAQRALGDATP
jgi:hypothetical protein